MYGGFEGGSGVRWQWCFWGDESNSGGLGGDSDGLDDDFDGLSVGSYGGDSDIRGKIYLDNGSW